MRFTGSLVYELILDFREQSNLKKIESLEKKLINNLDENAYSELLKLKRCQRYQGLIETKKSEQIFEIPAFPRAVTNDGGPCH